MRVVLGRAHEQVVDAVVRPCPPGVRRRGDPTLAAAGPELGTALRPWGRRTPLAPGVTVATPAGRLRALWLLHTCVPPWTVREDRSALLAQCYRTCLEVAAQTGSRTLAMPLLGSTLPFWPLERAVTTAVQVLRNPPGDLELVVLTLSSPAALEQTAEALARAGRD